MDILNALLADEVVWGLILTACLLTLADLVTGISGAARAGNFRLAIVAEFIQSHVVGRLLPIVAVAVLGHFEPMLAVIAAAAAAAYALETVGSIRDSFGLPSATTATVPSDTV